MIGKNLIMLVSYLSLSVFSFLLSPFHPLSPSFVCVRVYACLICVLGLSLPPSHLVSYDAVWTQLTPRPVSWVSLPSPSFC